MATGKRSGRRRPPVGRRAQVAPRTARAKKEPVPERVSTSEPSAETELQIFDADVAAGVAVAAAVVFLTTFSTHVALGDAPESVSGVKTLGVLHAPGYPAYVLAARLFADVVPVGGWAQRVNLFSLVCAALTIGVVYLLARSFGSNRAAAAVAALALATTASFWFNAGFAKHYAFSGLLVSVGALLGVAWQKSGRLSLLVASGVVLGAAFGASWELALIMTIGVIVLVCFGPRRPPVLHAVVAALGLLVVAGAGLGFMVWRAGRDPAINWGGVTNASRLIEQITQRDFQSQGQSAAGVGGLLRAAPGRLATYLGIITRDMGLGVLALAVVGAAVAATRATRDRKLFFAVVGLGNLVAVILVAGIDHIRGFFTGQFAGGYLLDVLIVLTVLVAIGATRLLDALDEWAAHRRASVAARRRLEPGRVRLAAVAALAIVLLAPSLLVHYRQADHRMPPLADLYGRRVLAALPQDSVLLVGGYEFSEPMTYRQVVDGERRDVAIVSADLLGLTWYRDQLARRMRLGPPFDPAAQQSNTDATVQLAALLRASRPVYLDTFAMLLVGNRIGYRAEGFVGRVVDGTGAHEGGSEAARAVALRRADEDDGLTGRRLPDFPNQFVYSFHQRADIELAKQFLLRKDMSGVESELQAAHTLVPDDTPTKIALALLARNDPRANAYIRNL